MMTFEVTFEEGEEDEDRNLREADRYLAGLGQEEELITCIKC